MLIYFNFQNEKRNGGNAPANAANNGASTPVNFANVDPPKRFIKPCKTRWLIYLPASDVVIDQWVVLKKFF